MKKRVIMVICFLASSLAFAGTGVDYFHEDWDEAREVAEKKGKPLFVHFTTEWCSWCRKIEKEVYKSKKGKKALEPYVPVSLDCTERGRQGEALQEARDNKKLMEKWGGTGFPFLVQVTADGNVLNSWSGYRPVDAFTETLAETLDNLNKFKQFEQKESADKDSYDYNVQAMEIYSGVGTTQKALEAADKVIELDPENDRGNNARASFIKMKMLQDEASWDKAGQALEKVEKYDPKNEKGLWEEGLRAYSEAVMRKARTMSSEERKRLTSNLLQRTKDLIDADVKLQKPQLTNYFLAMAYLQQGNQKKAVQELEKSIAMDSESDLAKHMKQILQNVNKSQ